MVEVPGTVGFAGRLCKNKNGSAFFKKLTKPGGFAGFVDACGARTCSARTAGLIVAVTICRLGLGRGFCSEVLSVGFSDALAIARVICSMPALSSPESAALS